MRLYRSWPAVQKKANQALRRLKETVNRAADDSGNGFYAWGQFLDYPTENRQRGVYGTAAAVLILSLSGDRDMPRCQGGIKWLLQQYDDANSRANKKLDFGHIYKLGFTALALHAVSHAESARLFERLTKWRHPSAGWGEFYFSPTLRDNQSGPMPTAFTFFVLSSYPMFRGSDEAVKLLPIVLRELEPLPPNTNSLVPRSLTIIGSHQAGLPLDEEIRRLLINPLIELRKERRGLGEWYPHHYSVRTGDDGESTWSNSYIFFPIDAMVAEALIVAGQIDRAYNVIWDIANFYSDRIIKDGAFRQRENQRPATIDQYWIARLLSAVASYTPKAPLPLRIWWAIESRLWLRIPILLTLSAVVGLGWFILSGIVVDLNANPNPSYRVGGWLLLGAIVIFEELGRWLFHLTVRNRKNSGRD